MNQRIAEIMRNHGLQKNISEDCQHRIEMIAELIIRECLNTIENSEGDLDFAVWSIKREFGVQS